MMRRKWSFEFTLSILIFLLVFAFTWQFKGVKKNSEIRERESLDRATLEKYYVDEVQKNEKLKLQIESQAATIEAFRNQAAGGNDYSAILNEKLSESELYAGLTNIEGKGITVTLDDAKMSEDTTNNGQFSNYGIVHDVNIRTFINELKAAGAEAISVNGQRIVAMSEVRCVGPTIMINGERVAAPFVIKAIGDPDAMESSLKIQGGAVEEATTLYKISVTIQKSDKVSIEKYVGSTQMKYAKTVKAEEGSKE